MLNYKCPACGAYMQYSAEKKCLVCEFCETTQSIDALTEEQRAELLDASSASTEVYDEPVEDSDGAIINLRHYICKNCGGEIMTDENTAATLCGFCGNPTLIEDRLSGEKSPAKIIPFAISREKAIDIYRNWTKQGKLTPKVFSSRSSLEKVTGMYVPFWLYDYKNTASMRANATMVRTERDSKFEYTHTDHFDVERSIQVEYEGIPVDASKKMDDNLMAQLEPYDYKELVEFQLPYLSGFQADKYDYTGEEMKQRADSRVKSSTEDALRATVSDYESVDVIDKDIKLKNTKQEYVLLPVWTLNYDYEGKHYMMTMNGQTGKIIGELPVSKGLAWKWFGGVFAAVFAVITLSALLF